MTSKQVLELNPNQHYEIRKTSELLHLKTPSCQRLVNEDRVDAIVSELFESLNQNIQPILPLCLCIAICNDNEYIVDGQHRLLAYIKILEKHHFDLKCCVNKIKVGKLSEIEELFALVNHSTPVPHLPDGVSMESVNVVFKYYHDRYKHLFSCCKSRKPRKPNIHEQDFIDLVVQLKQLKGLKDDEIIKKLDEWNKQCGLMTWKYFSQKSTDTQNNLEPLLQKCRDGFYLGMFPVSNWIHIIF